MISLLFYSICRIGVGVEGGKMGNEVSRTPWRETSGWGKRYAVRTMIFVGFRIKLYRYLFIQRKRSTKETSSRS